MILINNIIKCNNCNLCNNQLPLLDNIKKCDVMWVGLSAKKVQNINNSIPLENNTNSGKIIEQIELKLPKYSFYKTNLVKCLPLDKNNKLRYPTIDEMNKCIDNLIYEIEAVKPKVIFVLGRKNYNYIYKYFKNNNLNTINLIYIEHPSYIYIYKKKYIDDYINKVIAIIKNYV